MLSSRHAILSLFNLLMLLGLSGCMDTGYLLHSIRGHVDLMSRSRPVDEVLQDPATPESIRTQLQRAAELRSFATRSLSLPDTGSYRDYADLERPYAVWNLVAAPELSLTLEQWCFPVAGCVSYRGYFDEQMASAMAGTFAAEGYDVDVYGVPAYSTLNWFDDPILNTFLVDDEIRLASLLFHEMAHQVVYLPDDTAFNEAFAKTVEMEGLRRWFAATDTWQECLRRDTRSRQFRDYLDSVRLALADLYDSDLDAAQKRQAKNAILSAAVEDYTRLKAAWDGYDGFDLWMQKGLNNARLASVAVYHDLVPAFQQLLGQVGYDLPRFYDEVKALGKLDKSKRHARLQRQHAPHQAALK